MYIRNRHLLKLCQLKVSAPGSNIRSASHEGDDQYATMSGTLLNQPIMKICFTTAYLSPKGNPSIPQRHYQIDN